MLNVRAAWRLSDSLLLLGSVLGSTVACNPGTDPPGSFPARLGLAVAPALTAQSGVLLLPQPVIQLLDLQGAPVSTANRTVTAALATAGGTLTGTLQKTTDAAGRATFTDLAIAGLAGEWRLRFDSPNLPSVTTAPIQLSPGPAASLTPVTGNLQTSVAGTAVSIIPSVRLTDAAGNPIVAAAVSFTADNGGTVDGGTAVTNSSGIAAPTRWVLGTTLGLNTLTATSSAIPGSSVTFTATGSVGPPAALVIAAGEAQSAAVGSTLLIAPAVKVTDAAGHPLPSVSVTFVLATGGGTITDAVQLTNAAGIATLGSWTLGLLPGPNTLTVSSAGLAPVTVHATGLDFQVASLVAGSGHSCALNGAGVAYCWGSNATGQIGVPAPASVTMPTAVSGGVTFSSLSAGSGHTCGLDADGDAFCWGANDSGQLGDGTTVFHSMPAPVTGGFKFKAITAGGGFTCALLFNGTPYCWGANQSGRLGDSTTVSKSAPTLVYGGRTFQAISAGSGHACGLELSGVLLCWGLNGNGQVGDNTGANRLAPTPVGGGLSYSSVSAGGVHTCGIATTGAGFCWGGGAAGRLGNGFTFDAGLPEGVKGGLTFSKISAHLTHTCALTTGGLTYCWGGNIFGELGDGNTISQSEPVLVLGGLTFTTVAAGAEHTCGRSSAGGAYCWGRNDVGAVGDKTLVSRPKPVGVVRP